MPYIEYFFDRPDANDHPPSQWATYNFTTLLTSGSCTLLLHCGACEVAASLPAGVPFPSSSA